MADTNFTKNNDGSSTLSVANVPISSEAFTANGTTPVVPNVPANTTINSSNLQQQAAVQIPPPAPIDTGAGANLSIPTPQSIIDQSTKPTETDTNQSRLLGEVAKITGGQKSLATQQTEAQKSAGLPTFAATVRSLSSQLQGYNDQSAKLQLDASAGGTIQNQILNNSAGVASTSAINGQTQAALRNNQIQQATISSQALTTKAALYAAQNDYANAKDAADKAAQVAFDADTQKINGLKAQLDAITPTLNKEEKARAALVQAQLADRKTQIDNAREDFKTGQALAIATIKNYPDDTAAQFAAQQALKLDPKSPDYFQKVTALIGKYQQDPIEKQNALLDQEYKRAQIAKLKADAKAAGVPEITNTNAAPYAPALKVILGSANFTVQQKQSLVQAVNSGQDPAAVIKNQAKNVMGETNASTVTKYETAQSSLKDIQQNLKDFYALGGKTNVFSGNYEKVINKLGSVNDPKLVDLATQIQANLQVYRNAVSGTAYSAQEGADIASIFPGINKTEGLNNAILTGRMKAFDSTIDGAYKSVLGSTYDAVKSPQSTNTPPSTVIPATQIPSGYYQASDGLLYKK